MLIPEQNFIFFFLSGLVSSGSLSPRGRSFDNCVDEMQRAEELRNFLNDVASSSKNTSQRSDSGGWSSSEDDADPMDENEGSLRNQNKQIKADS